MPESIAQAVASVGGIGLIGISRGPIVVALTVLVYLALPRNRPLMLILAALVIVVGWWAATVADSLTAEVDAGHIVIDEVAGAAIMLAIAMPRRWQMAAGLGVGFWFLDSVKPWPFHYVEAVPGAAGIMLDDLVIGAALGLGYGIVMVWLATRGPFR